VAGSDIFPVAKVYGRLTRGPEDDVWQYYQVLRRKLVGEGRAS
jgi:hypothetical protein